MKKRGAVGRSLLRVKLIQVGELINLDQPVRVRMGADLDLRAAPRCADLNSRLVNPKKEKMALAFVGNAQVGGKNALEVELTTATGMKRDVFFDPQTHLIVKEAATVGGLEEEILYDD